ncbi:uncharacterized protein BYT42DRAFT_568877 [Radiomyces spectabilis]|uniref:uncharacterized protein n=1 Tax=Radiomyces spectabilis TaxID=64574 RepID=UPI00221ECF7B|nr:uncharacterized protein BYT42DRAFT_568877 [Radiomyces spectabilis]KAI8379457.1 hypothetical protein BYT42DRAFT_568877 [Radiomyces spectabilis]
MDPGYKLLQHIKTVPNLINEDPSITTPKNSSFMDLPWSQFSTLLNRRSSDSSASVVSGSSTPSLSEDESVEDVSLGNWDSMTGYQDGQHIPMLR